jgi:hypothetical protein
LFDWYASLIPGGSRHRDLAHAVEEAREVFRPSGEPPRYTLCLLSHETRKRENEEANEREAAQHATKMRVQGDGPNQQSFWAYVGKELIGGLTLSPVQNGCFYDVVALHSDGLDIQARGDGTVESVGLQVVQKALRPAHALTLASCQGLTLRGRVRVLAKSLPVHSASSGAQKVLKKAGTLVDVIHQSYRCF